MDDFGIEATQALDFGNDDETDDEAGDNEPVAFLNVACQKGFAGKSFPVYEGDNVIGRHEDCAISIPLKALSREHACIEVKGDAHFIYDKGSRNRTRRNGHFLAASVRYELRNKDKLIFGDVECEYQIGAQTEDDGSETGSESMFQTAPDDQEIDEPIGNKGTHGKKPLDEEDYASDASSDILEPTQGFTANTQSMLSHRSVNGHSVLGANVTVGETPAPPSRNKRVTGANDLIPESEDEEEGPVKPPANLIADGQDDGEEDDDDAKAKLIGAATQAYVCESDVTTDDEGDNSRSRRSLLAAPTQAFVQDDDDVSTCSEDSPQKKRLMTAATQAFVADSDDDKTPRRAQMAPTLAYDMEEGIEATQGYDMDEREEEVTKDNKSKKILFEPTQAYIGAGVDDEGDDKSETSEEFVLEGDTDAEDAEGESNILAAPTLAADIGADADTPTQAVSDEATQVVDSTAAGDGATVAVSDDATQVFDEPAQKQTPKKTKHVAEDRTLPVTEIEMQVFDDKNDSKKTTEIGTDDATQVFDNMDDKPDTDVQTLVIEEATQVFDKTTGSKSKKGAATSNDATQVFDDMATQCFDDQADVKITEKPKKAKIDDKPLSDNQEASAQVFDQHSEDGETFDINADSTLAVAEDESSGSAEADQRSRLQDQTPAVKLVDTEAATQVFEETVAVSDETVAVEEPVIQEKTVGRRGKNKSSKKVLDKISDTNDATQVFDETVPVDDQTATVGEPLREHVKGKDKNMKNKKTAKSNQGTNDATQVFDETVQVSDQTVAVEELTVEEKPVKGRGKNKKAKTRVEDKVAYVHGSTRVFDKEVIEAAETVAIDESTDEPKSGRRKRHQKADNDTKTLLVSDDATQVFEETVQAIDSEPYASIKSESSSGPEAATQVFDETLPVGTLAEDEIESPPGRAKSKRGTKGKSETEKISNDMANAEATRVLKEPNPEADENLLENETVTRKSTALAGNKRSEKTEIESDSKPKQKGKGRKSKTQIAAEDVDTSVSKAKIDNVNETASKEKDEDHVETLEEPSKRTRSGRHVKAKKFADEDDSSDNIKLEPGKEQVTVDVRKSRRTRSKATASSNEMERASEGPENKSEVGGIKPDGGAVDKEIRTAGKAKTKQSGKKNKESNLEAEIATQAYIEEGASDGEATQKYGDAEDEDLTPDISEAGSENLPTVPVVVEEHSRGRTPLKSALASPKKKSPSPKKVMFVSQTSETSSESSEPSRRSKRRGNNTKLECKDKTVPATETENKDKRSKIDETTTSTRRQTRAHVQDNIAESDSKEDETKTKKSTRKGRKSVELSVSEKIATNGRKTRTSLPAVIEDKDQEKNEPKEQSKRNESKTQTRTTARERSKQKTKMETSSDIQTHLSAESNTGQSVLTVGKSKKHNDECENLVRDIKSETVTTETVSKARPASTRSSRSAKQIESTESVKIDTKPPSRRKRKLSDGDKHTSESHAESLDEVPKSSVAENGSKTKKTRSSKGETLSVASRIPTSESSKNDSAKCETLTKGKNSKGNSTPMPETEENSSQKSTRSTRGKKNGLKAAKEENKLSSSEQEVQDSADRRGMRNKRKESASSSTDSQEGETDGTPAKRQKKKNDHPVSTPKQPAKQTVEVSAVNTPKSAACKQMETDVTNSPVLRKTTTEGVKAKVMFTGVIDEQGEKIVKELGGDLISSVTECTHLVTDQVRRTVKFLCCLSRGVPIVSPQWLVSSKTSGFFVDTGPFLVKDESSERKYKFILESSLEKASREPLFAGYTFHITKSVKPEPQHMKEILKCAGAKCVDRVPHKASSTLLVVISCPEDRAVCEPAYKAGIPVLTAEFVLTGILRQEADLNLFKLEKEENGSRRQSLAAEKRKT